MSEGDILLREEDVTEVKKKRKENGEDEEEEKEVIHEWKCTHDQEYE